MMNSPRLIKRYPNRRLYDTETSRYITADEIKQLVLDHIEFQVFDLRTKSDYTNEILLQIINHQENLDPIFTTQILQNMIRFYGNPMQSVMTNYLEKVTALTKNNIAVWESTFSNFFKQDK